MSDQIFAALAREILSGTRAPDSPLPPERELARRFGVSRIIVRQAVHRLKELDLVDVRQGAATVVRDPTLCSDVRLVNLEMELLPLGKKDRQDVTERTLIGSLGLIALAEQRITSDELDVLDRIVNEYIAGGATDEEMLAFEREYWLAIARATRNRICLRETLWILNTVEQDPTKAHLAVGGPRQRASLYRTLNERLRAGQGATEMFLQAARFAVNVLEHAGGSMPPPPPKKSK